MHDCALGKEGGPSAPRVEHRYYANGGIKIKKILVKIQLILVEIQKFLAKISRVLDKISI